MPGKGSQRNVETLALAGLAVWFAATALLSLTDISDPDFGRHIAYGRLLWSNFASVGRITFGQDPAVLSQAYSYWLYEAFSSLLFDRLGPAAIVIMRAVLIVGAFAGAAFLARKAGARLWGIALVTAAALSMSQERFLDRPELLSFAAWVAAIYILILKREGRGIWLLIPLQVIWVNTHLWFGLLPGLVVAFALGDLISRRGRIRRDALLLGALLISTFLNPAGPGTWKSQLYLVQFLGQGYSLPFPIEEMRSPFSSYLPTFAVWVFRIAMPAGILIAIAGRKRITWGGVLTLIFAAALASKARRGIPLFGLAAIAIVPVALDDLARSLSARGRLLAETALAAVVLATGIAGVYALASGRFFLAKDADTRISLTLSPHYPALKAARFIAQERIAGPTFAIPHAAGALVLENGTRIPPFLDARWFGTPETIADYQALRTSTDDSIAETWKAIDAKRHFEVAILDFYEMPALLRFLSDEKNTEWATVYVDETAAVFLRRDATNMERIHRLEPKILLAMARRDAHREEDLSKEVMRFLASPKPSIFARLSFPYEPFYRANYALQIRHAFDAQAAYLEVLKEEKGSLHLSRHRVEILNNLFWCLLRTNQPAGINALAKALQREPSTPPDHRRAIAAEEARALDALGEGAKAEEVARRLIEDPQASSDERWASWCRIASVRTKAEDFPAAADALEHAAQEKPTSAETYRSLGAILDLKLAKPAEALEAYQKFRSLAGSDKDVDERIRVLSSGAGAPK